MQKPLISLIAAMTENRVIGRDNALPWRLPADMRHFVTLTRGKPIVMGRKNYQDIGRPLPKRHNIVLTHDTGFDAPGCTVSHNAEQALAAAGDVAEVMIVGGEAIYRLFLPRADRVYLTVVHSEIEGDRYFPPLDKRLWKVTARRERAPDEDNRFALTFFDYRRVSEA